MNLGHGSELSVIHLTKFTTAGNRTDGGYLFLAEDISWTFVLSFFVTLRKQSQAILSDQIFAFPLHTFVMYCKFLNAV